MPRITCQRCKLTFSIKDPKRKMTDCPECGARVHLDGNDPPPASTRRRSNGERSTKKGIPALVIVLVLVVAFMGIGVVGGAVWYFALRKPIAKPQANNPEPVIEALNDKPVAKSPAKRLKISPTAKLEGNDIYKLLLPATAMIRNSTGLGTGVLICRDPNLVVTNHHVVGSDATVRVFFPEFDDKGQVIRERSYYDENRFKLAIRGRVLERSKAKDLAIIEVDRVPETAQPVPLAKESAKELDRVYGIGGSSADLNALWQAHEGSVRQILPPNEIFEPLNCRLMISQQPTFFGDSGGPIVSSGVELVAVVQGGLPAKGQLFKDRKGQPIVRVDTREGMALNVDVEEIRSLVSDVWKQKFIGTFPEIPPLHEPGISPPPAGEDYAPSDYVQILREGDPTQARAAVDRLAHYGAASVPPIKTLLEDQSAATRWPQALLALEKIGAPAVAAAEAIAATLSSENANVRIAAVRCLGAIGQPARKYVPAMIRAGGGNNPSVRVACEKAIIKLGPFTAADLTMILGAADDKDSSILGLRARLLVEMDIPEADKAARLEPFFKHANPVVRADATRAICKPDKFPRPAVYRLVLPFLGDAEYSVRSAAREALFNMGRVEVADLDALREFFASDSAEVHFYLLQRIRPLGERAAPIVPELGKSLRFANDEVKIEAIQTALAIGQNLKALSKDFAAISRHDQSSFRWAAVQCLKQAGKDEPGVVAALFERLSDGGEVTTPPRSLDELAAKSFGDMKDKVRLISDLPPVNPKARPVWQFTTVLLNEMRPFKTEAQIKEIMEFVRPAEKRSIYAQYFAALCIAESGLNARTALDDTMAALADPKVTDHEIREKLCDAIGNCGPDGSRAAKLLAQFAAFEIVEDRARSPGDQQRQKNQVVRAAALRAIAKLGPGAKDAMPALVKLADPLSDVNTQDETIKTLGNIGAPAANAVPNLMQLFLKARPAQRDLIVDACKKIGPGVLPHMVDFLPIYEKNWREGVGGLKDHLPTARGCVECIIALGPEGLSKAQKDKLVDALKSLRARAAIKRELEFEGRLAVALARVDPGKK